MLVVHVPHHAVVGSSTAGVRTVVGSGDLDAGSRLRVASLTKTATSAALVLELRQRGLALSTPAVELLPGLAPDWRADRGVTVEHLLAQVAGLAESVDAPAVAALGEGDQALLEAARSVVRGGSVRAPGERWSYYNGNYLLAGALLASVAGTTYEEALRRRVLDPWGLADTSFDGPDAGYPRGRRPSGGLWSTVSDLLTLGERLLADTDLLAQTARPRTAAGDPKTYGLGWAVGPSGQLFLNGRLPGHRAAFVVVPQARLVAVALSDRQDTLPALGRALSDLQRGHTGDDLAGAIDAFAA